MTTFTRLAVSERVTLVLAHSALPLANEALAAGFAARVAAKRAEDSQAELERRESRPLPDKPRERRWALQNRASYRAECEERQMTAAQLTERWARLQDQLEAADPRRADLVDETVWGALTTPAPCDHLDIDSRAKRCRDCGQPVTDEQADYADELRYEQQYAAR